MSRSLLLLLLFAYIGFAASLLIRGSDLLVYPLIEGPYVPLGNVLTWLMFIAFPLAILQLGPPKGPGRKIQDKIWTIMRGALILNLILAFSWLPLSRIVSGNWSTSFRGGSDAAEYWWAFTYGLPILSLVMGTLLLIWRGYAGLTRTLDSGADRSAP
jgi:hypothetical protein